MQMANLPCLLCFLIHHVVLDVAWTFFTCLLDALEQREVAAGSGP